MDKIQVSKNEWDPLKKVIVGVADFARIPTLDKSLRTVNYSHVKNEEDIPAGSLYQIDVIREANEDLDRLSLELTKLGVEVVRPINRPTDYYNYCPRDLATIIDTKAIIAPMSLQSRKDDYKNIESKLKNIYYVPNNQSDDNYNLYSVGNKDILALNELHPKFDAANILRANNDILYLVSNSGNRKGAEYLQQLLGNKYNVHLLEGVYSYMHIDSTVAFLREGLMLLNPSRIPDKSVMPYPFNTWDAIYCPDPVDIGYTYYNNASPWINVNLLSITDKLVILEENQEPTRKELEKYGIECLMLPMRHARTLGGCFHCVTLDLVRNSNG
jgi:glycine amidinotransferase/scyllo-inosamine-4-phosphate amidinotransferase 1